MRASGRLSSRVVGVGRCSLVVEAVRMGPEHRGTIAIAIRLWPPEAEHVLTL